MTAASVRTVMTVSERLAGLSTIDLSPWFFSGVHARLSARSAIAL